jgi:oligopeptidase A
MSQGENANPLLENHPLPPFDRITPDHVAPAVDLLIDRWRQALAEILAGEEPSFATLAAIEEVLADKLDGAFSPVAHLHSVADSPEWREAYASAVVKLSDFGTELNQDRERFQAYAAIAERDDFSGLAGEQQRIVKNTLRDFRLAGVDLSPPDRERYAGIVRRLTELATSFEQHLQDSTDAWQLDFDGPEALAGLPQRSLDEARERAGQAGNKGYRICLEYPSYQAVITYAEDRELRREIYTAYLTRASDSGPHAGRWDNGPVIREILSLRRELAELVGFDSYLEYSLATKMVNKPGQVTDFLQQLVARARPRAGKELAELAAFASSQGGPERLEPWDVPLWSERLRKARFDIAEEEIRPYFPYPGVLEGLLAVAGELFGLSFRKSQPPLYHPQVSFIEVLDDRDEVVAALYLDPYAREKKRGGAWMADCRSLRRTDTGWQRPVAFLTCNFPAPTESRPSLLSHDEVITLFHEFGHTLHHLLTRIEHPSVGGISGVEWDAVELPSQFLENWCWQRPALDRIARHHQSGEALPEALWQRMLAARHFHASLRLVRQLEFALTDFHLHQDPSPDITAIQQRVRDQVAVIQAPSWGRFLNGFSHLFAGGYGAGYYSYLWAEQLAADAFSRFEEEGVFNPRTGQSFRAEVLEVGGSRDAIESFRAFRGRDPEIAPLLRSYGID